MLKFNYMYVSVHNYMYVSVYNKLVGAAVYNILFVSTYLFPDKFYINLMHYS